MGLGVLRAAFFLNGNLQFVAYAGLLEALTWWWGSWRRRGGRAGLALGGSLLLTGGIVLPLLLPQLAYASTVRRWAESAGGSSGLSFDGLAALALPWPMTQASYPASSPPFAASTSFYFLGPLWLAAGLWGAWRWLRARSLPGGPMLALAALLFLLSLGRASMLQPLYMQVPLLNQMRFLSKLLPYGFFILLLWALPVLEQRRRQGLPAWAGVLAAAALLQAWVYLALSAPLYPGGALGLKPEPLPSGIARALAPESLVLSLAGDGPGDPRGLGANFAPVYGLRSSACYDEFVPLTLDWPAPNADWLAWAAARGFSHVLTPSAPAGDLAGVPATADWTQGLSSRHADVEEGGWRLYATGRRPWWFEGPGDAGAIEGGRSGDLAARLSARQAGTWRAALRFRPDFVLTVDGTVSATAQEAHGWLSFALPAGVHDVRIVYRPRAWVAGWTGAVLLIGFALWILRLITLPTGFERRSSLPTFRKTSVK
jgi:hypothetical protein